MSNQAAPRCTGGGGRLDSAPPQPDRGVAVGRACEGLAGGGARLSWFFSTITSFGTPHDVTLEELRIECSFPADEATATACRELFGS
jgi:hypothetical protein